MIEQHVSHFYKISTGDRISGNPNNCIIGRPNLDDVHSFRVEEIVMPYTCYPVNSYNNTLVFNPNAGGNVTATITPGVYTTASFITELQTQMAAVSGGPTYVVTISTATGKITITQNTGTFTVVRASSTAWNVLGLNQSLGTSAAALAFTSDGVINLGGTNIIIVTSRELTKFGTKSISSQNNSQSDIIARIPVNVAWGSNLVFQPYNKVFMYEGRKGNDIDFKLYDQWYNPLDLNGSDWFINLKFHTSKLSNIELRHQMKEGDRDNYFSALTYSVKN